MAIFTLMTGAKVETLDLERVSFIHYPVQFKKDAHGNHVQALIDSGSEVNAMAIVYASKLDLKVYPTNIGA